MDVCRGRKFCFQEHELSDCVCSLLLFPCTATGRGLKSAYSSVDCISLPPKTAKKIWPPVGKVDLIEQETRFLQPKRRRGRKRPMRFPHPLIGMSLTKLGLRVSPKNPSYGSRTGPMGLHVSTNYDAPGDGLKSSRKDLLQHTSSDKASAQSTSARAS